MKLLDEKLGNSKAHLKKNIYLEGLIAHILQKKL